MFKFIKQYAETIDNAQVYPIFSLIIFFLFFVVLLIYVKKIDKSRISDLSKLPLDNEKQNIQNI